MAALIENWVKSKVGISIALDSPNVADHLYDGYTFFQILQRYDIKNTYSHRPSNRANVSASVALRNLRLLRPSFHSIGISLPDSDLVKISQKDRSKCLWLLFELHLRLESTSKVNVAAREKVREEIREKFTLKRKTADATKTSQSLKDTIMFEKDLNKRREIFGTDSNVYNVGFQQQLSFKQMVKLDTESLFYKDLGSTCRHVQRDRMKDAVFKLNVGNALMNDMWESFLGGREDYFSKLLNRKLQAQSKYETELGIRLAGQNLKNQNRFSNTIESHCENAENNFFKKMSLEKKYILNLHNKLYGEKLNRWRELKRKICGEIVSDMIDLAILISEFHSQNGVPPTRFIMNDWKELFFQGIPFFIHEKSESTVEDESESDSASHTTSHTYEDVRTIDTQLLLDRVVCERLINFYVHSYLYLVGNWKIEYWPELGSGNEKLNVQGFIVHRLLECKYPLPNPPKPANMDHLKIRAVIKNFFEPACLQSLEVLLKKPKILLIKYSDAVRYCTDVYEYEKSIVSIGLPKTSGTQTKKKTKIVSSKMSEPIDPTPTYANKSVQCPEIAEKHRFVIHSKVGQLGQLATEGDTLSDNVLSTKIMVEYIQSLKKYNGFVLVDFPINESQAVLLEFLITGRPIELDMIEYNIDEAVREFIFNAMNPPYTIDTRKLIDLESLFSNLLLETTLEVIPTYYDIKKSMKSKMEEVKEVFEEGNMYEELPLEEESNTEISYLPFNKSEQTSSPPTEFKPSSKGTKENGQISSDKLSVEVEPEDDYVGLLEEEVKIDQHTRTVSFVELRQLRTSKILPRPNERIVPPRNTRTIITSCIVKFTEIKQAKVQTSSLLAVTKAAVAQDKGATAYAKLVSPQNYYKDFNVLIPYILSDNGFSPTEVARLILNEPMHPNHPRRIPSEELFGSDAVASSKKYKVQKIKRLSPISFNSPVSKEKIEVSKDKKKSQNKKNRKNSLRSLNLGTEFLDVPTESEETASVEFSTPGTSAWKYVDEPLPEDFQSALASHWEIVEYVYLEGLHQVMNLFHIHNASFFPHRNFIRNLMNEDVDQNSCRQQMVSNFQIMFNEVDDVHRHVPQMKMELHCKVHELWNRLCEMADSNKRVLELQLNKIMEEGKFLNYCYTLINIFLSLMQLEIDRYVDTVQIINVYYLKMLCEEPTKSKMEKIQIKKLVIPTDEEYADFNVVSSGNADLRQTFFDDSVKKLKKLNDWVFLDWTDLDFLIKFVKTRVNQIAKKSYQCSKAVENFVNDSSVGVTLRRKIKHKLQRKTKARKAIVAPNLQRAINCNDAKMSVFKTSSRSRASGFFSHERDLIDTIKWEWSAAICDEEERLHFRIKLIEAKMMYDLNETFVLTKKFYESFVTDIAVRYHHEQQAIHRLCRVLRSAINSECAIRPKLILEKDKFYMGKEDGFDTGLSAPPPTPWRKVSWEYRFTMEQMNKFVDKMNYVAPSGLIGVAFIKILEDMVSSTTETYHPYLPLAWQVLDKDIIEYILYQAFGSVDVLDWRDFVIFNMNIPLPQIDHLLKLKKEFKAVGNTYNDHISYRNFKKIPLWFESQNCVDDVQLAKEVLFKLYQVNETEMDYGVFLLSFCKGEDNIEGFMKMLMLVDDKGLMINAESHIEKAKKKKEAKEIVREIMNLVIHKAVLNSEGVVIKTFTRNETVKERKKARKSSRRRTPRAQQEEKLFEEDGLSSDDMTNVIYIPAENPEAEVTYPERYYNPMWHVCIPYQLVFKLLSIACIHKLGSDSMLRDLNEKLINFYETEGKDGYVKACVLAESEFSKLLFDTISIFRWCNMPYFVESLIRSSFFTTQNSSLGL